MGLDVLFGVVVAGFLAAWSIWMISISNDRRATILGTTVLVGLLAVAIIVINTQRLDDQRDSYRDDIVAFIDEAAAEEEEAFTEQETYVEDVPAVAEGDRPIDGGVLQMEVALEPELDGASREGYSVSGKIESEEYTLTVSRTADGGTEEARTCSANESAGCVDEVW